MASGDDDAEEKEMSFRVRVSSAHSSNSKHSSSNRIIALLPQKQQQKKGLHFFPAIHPLCALTSLMSISSSVSLAGVILTHSLFSSGRLIATCRTLLRAGVGWRTKLAS